MFQTVRIHPTHLPLKRRRSARLCMGAALMSALVGFGAQLCVAGQVFYRYVNDEGVKVLDSSIPPRYVQNGYQVVSANGELIKNVDPAPDEEDVEAARLEQEELARLQRWNKELLRRYSSVRDIEAAKKRKLAQVNNNVAILKGNISNIDRQLSAQHAKAANFERSGRDIPDVVMANIKSLNEEKTAMLEQLQQRQQQHQEIADKYDRDIQRFQEIHP